MGLGGTYSSALEDWLLTKHKISNSINHFPLSDSVPDLTGFNENSGISTNHSTPQRVTYNQHMNHNNNSRYLANSNGYPHQLQPHNNVGGIYSNGFYGTPTRVINKNEYNNDDDNDVQLRRPVAGGHNGHIGRRCENGNEREDWYRRPLGPHDNRHSGKI